MNQITTIACIVLLGALIGCTKDRSFAPPSTTPPAGGSGNIVKGTLTINEFMAKGSAFYNELDPVPGDNDWVEIFNTTEDTIYLSNEEWFLTDLLTDTTKFALPDTFILPRNFLTIECDSRDTLITQIHSNFNLSSAGEDIGLYYIKNDEVLLVDSYTYTAQTPGVAMARFPDGSANWIFTTHPTPKLPNQE
jgi:hypothetical protein